MVNIKIGAGLVFLLCIILAHQVNCQAYDDKYKDGIYKEEDVPEYELPDVLRCFNGQKVRTAELDLWADQKGQWIATYHAAPVYRLYGEEVAFTSSEQPKIICPVIESAIGYYVRSGYHGLTFYDWERYIEFIEYHFMPPVG